MDCGRKVVCISGNVAEEFWWSLFLVTIGCGVGNVVSGVRPPVLGCLQEVSIVQTKAV